VGKVGLMIGAEPALEQGLRWMTEPEGPPSTARVGDIGGTGKVVGDQAPQWAFPAASPPFQSQVHGVNGLRARQRRTTDGGFCAGRLLAEGK
jgi:hypothetical protein